VRKIGEKNFSYIPSRKRPKDIVDAAKIKVAVLCKRCGVESRQPQVVLYKYYRKGFICHTCSMKEREELQQSIRNIARRKLEIKQETKDV
jgi:hypothetical protein